MICIYILSIISIQYIHDFSISWCRQRMIHTCLFVLWTGSIIFKNVYYPIFMFLLLYACKKFMIWKYISGNRVGWCADNWRLRHDFACSYTSSCSISLPENFANDSQFGLLVRKVCWGCYIEIFFYFSLPHCSKDDKIKWVYSRGLLCAFVENATDCHAS